MKKTLKINNKYLKGKFESDFSKELNDLELDVERKIEIINLMFIDGNVVKKKDIPLDFYQ